MEQAQQSIYDVTVLDLGLPRMDGMIVLSRLRASGFSSHVLTLTARDSLAGRVAGLRNGADDYLVKPFDMDELVARVDALARRSHRVKDPHIVIGALVVDAPRRG